MMTIYNDGLFPSDDGALLLGCYLTASERSMKWHYENALLKPELHDEDNDDGDNEDDYNDSHD